MDPSKERKRTGDTETRITLLTLFALTQGVPMPSEEDFHQLADDLENNRVSLPPGLTPKDASLLARMFRVENLP